jgi:hypothetical protein
MSKRKISIDSILTQEELVEFNTAEETWNSMTHSTIQILENIAEIVSNINLLYDKGMKKGLEESEIISIIKANFTGLFYTIIWNLLKKEIYTK